MKIYENAKWWRRGESEQLEVSPAEACPSPAMALVDAKQGAGPALQLPQVLSHPASTWAAAALYTRFFPLQMSLVLVLCYWQVPLAP